MGPEWAEGPPSPWGLHPAGVAGVPEEQVRSRLPLRVWGWGIRREAGDGVPSSEQGRGVCSGVGPTERCFTQQGQEGVPRGRTTVWVSGSQTTHWRGYR